MESKIEHEKKVLDIQNQLKNWNGSNKKKRVRVYHRSTNSTRSINNQDYYFIDISALNQILEINTEEMYVLVEPNVSMEYLVNKTLQYGLIPPIVMEFPGITVGGGVQGGAGECSSFHYGLFDDICEEYEVILGDGRKIMVSKKKNADFFRATPGSYGSLGIITMVKLRLILAKKYVHLKYLRVNDFKKAIDLIGEETKKNHQYIDAIFFKKDLGVVMIGDLSNERLKKTKTFLNFNDDWFYLHARKLVNEFTFYEEVIPIKDYLFRYDKGAFWAGKLVCNRFYIPFNKFFRLINNPLFISKTLYKLLHATNISQDYIIQDICLPKSTSIDFLRYIDQEIMIYPLWICPISPSRIKKLSPSYIKTDLIMNIGMYGEMGNRKDYFKINRDIELMTSKLGGRKVFYAHSYYPQKEFWRIYNLGWYEKLRTKYQADKTFPSIYEKIFVGKAYKRSIIKGLIGYLRKRFGL